MTLARLVCDVPVTGRAGAVGSRTRCPCRGEYRRRLAGGGYAGSSEPEYVGGNEKLETCDQARRAAGLLGEQTFQFWMLGAVEQTSIFPPRYQRSVA